MMWRAEKTQPHVRLLAQLLQQGLCDARLADSRLAYDQDDGTVAGLCPLPAARQQCDLFLATNQRRAGGPKGLEATADRARTQDPPDMHRIVDTGDRQWAKIAIVEQAAKQAARVVRDDNSVRFGKPLEPGRKIGGLTNDRLFLGGALTKQIADDDEASGDTNTHPQRGRQAIELGHRLDQRETRAHSLFSVLLMRLRITEIGQHAVTEIFCNKATRAGDHLGATAVIGTDDVAQLLRIEPRRQCSGTDEVGEHDRELAAFGSRSFGAGAVGLDRMFGGLTPGFSSQRGDRIEENAAMADRRHAEVSEVLGGQLGQACLIDRVFPECLPVAFQAEVAQPGRDIHGVHTHTWPHSSQVIAATAPTCTGGQAARPE